MALEYDSNTEFEALAPILEDYADWFGRIAVYVAYPDDDAFSAEVTVPSSFRDWMENTAEDTTLSPAILKEIATIHDAMISQGESIFVTLQNKTRPARHEFVDFKGLYSGFLSRLRRLEKDSALEGSGFDEETGLRAAHHIETDTKKEMERLSRQGNAFSLVMARIDRFAGQEDQKKALELSVKSIKDCMRPFDDAYYMGNGVFLLSLKQADILGAEAAVNRLQLCLKEDTNNTKPKVTMSYCMTEPLPEDETETLIKNMQADLIEHLNDEDAVLKFVEISPLARFVQSKE